MGSSISFARSCQLCSQHRVAMAYPPLDFSRQFPFVEGGDFFR
jgi:hypothetical protein